MVKKVAVNAAIPLNADFSTVSGLDEELWRDKTRLASKLQPGQYLQFRNAILGGPQVNHTKFTELEAALGLPEHALDLKFEGVNAVTKPAIDVANAVDKYINSKAFDEDGKTPRETTALEKSFAGMLPPLTIIGRLPESRKMALSKLSAAYIWKMYEILLESFFPDAYSAEKTVEIAPSGAKSQVEMEHGGEVKIKRRK